MGELLGRYDNIKKLFILKNNEEVVICLEDEGGVYNYYMRDFSIVSVECTEFGMEVASNYKKGEFE